MPTMMMTVMDEFYALQDVSYDMEYRIIMDKAISYANNCHQMSPFDVLNRIGSNLDGLTKCDSLGDQGRIAVNDAISVIDKHRESLMTNNFSD